MGLCPACLAGVFFSADDAVPLSLDEPVLEPGNVVGCYRLVEPLGEGGFAIVYRAEQEQPIRRQVALKLLKPGLDSRMVTARFEAERQALAMLEHPNISRVLDAGTMPDGRPYFVMELVEGLPVTLFCERHRLGLEERLRLFLDVCSGMEHAHAKGVIHRDLKPTNVLAAHGAESGVLRATIIDFGIAKALWQELTPRTLYTSPRLMLGTPQYMSPEQAHHGGLDIDTRADVYSLGALLYEMLTGRPPLEDAGTLTCGMEEWLRRIRERVPSRPSRLLSPTLKTGQGRLAVVRSVENEFDWVVLKALEKERSRRYQTVRELAEDVRRFLDDEPVMARPPSWGYLTRKFVRKHRLQVIAVALAVASLIALSLLGVGLALRAERAERETRTAFSLADAGAAHEMVREDRYGEAIALLCRSLRMNPENREASYRLMSLLAEAPAGILAGPTLRFRDSASHGMFLPAEGQSHRILTVHPRLGDLMLWDWSPTSATLVREIHGPGVIAVFAVSLDGKQAAVSYESGAGRELRIHSLDEAEDTWRTLLLSSEAVSASEPMPECVALAFSSEGQKLFVATTDRRIRAWHLTEARWLWEAVCEGVPHHLEASPDGRRVAAAMDSRIVLLDALDGGCISAEYAQRHRVEGVKFTADGGKVFAAGGDTFARALDADTGQRHGDLQHFERIRTLALSPRGERVATGGDDGLVRLRTLKGQQLGAYRLPHAVCALEFSQNGELLASASQHPEPRVAVLDAETGLPNGPSLQLRNQAAGFSFHSDSHHLLVTSPEDEMVVFDVRQRRMNHRELNAGRELLHAGFLSSGLPYALTVDGCLLHWKKDLEDAPREVFRLEGKLAAYSISKQSALVVTGQKSHLVDLDTGVVRSVVELTGPTNSVYLTPQGAHFLVMDAGEMGFSLFHSSTGERLYSWVGTDSAVSSLTCMEDGSRVFSAHRDGRLKIHEVRAGNVVDASDGNVGAMIRLQLSPHETILLGASAQPSLYLWNPLTGKLVSGEKPLRHPGKGGVDGIRTLFASHTEEFFSFNAWDSRVRAFETRAGAPSGPSLAHAGIVTHAVQSPGGSLLFTAEHDGQISLWHLDRNLPAAASKKLPSPVAALAFSPNGRVALAAGVKGVVHLWMLPPEQPEALPEVFLRFAEGYGRMHLTPENVMEEVSFQTFDAARRQVLALPEKRGDAVRAWMKWLATDPGQRLVWPENAGD